MQRAHLRAQAQAELLGATRHDATEPGVPMQRLPFEADDARDVVRLPGDRQDTSAVLHAEG